MCTLERGCLTPDLQDEKPGRGIDWLDVYKEVDKIYTENPGKINAVGVASWSVVHSNRARRVLQVKGDRHHGVFPARINWRSPRLRRNREGGRREEGGINFYHLGQPLGEHGPDQRPFQECDPGTDPI